MERFKTHVIMVSGQPTPNVLPVMDKAIRPEKVILCTTTDMRKKAGILENYFQTRGIKTRRFDLEDAYDFSGLQEKFLMLAAELENSQAEVAVNLTGGTKLMAIAAQKVFGDDFSCFYVNAEKNAIQCISTEKVPEYTISEQLELKDFFAIHGYQITGSQKQKDIPKKSEVLFRKLLGYYNDFSSSLGTLNYLANEAEKAETLTVKNNIPEKSWALLSLFQDHGAVKSFDDRSIEFNSSADRRFCRGFWLEDWVWLSLKKLAENVLLQDYASSIQIESDNSVQNEIDAAFLFQNRLFLIECKTADLEKDGKSAAPLYKLDSLHNISGIFTQAILVSYMPVEAYGKQRAEDLKIEVIEKEKLLGLSTILKKKLTRSD